MDREENLRQSMEKVWEITELFEKAVNPGAVPAKKPDFSSVAKRTAEEIENSGEVSRCDMEHLKAMCGTCSKCRLGGLRKNNVFGEGVENPLVMVVGEGPGAGEDETGRPFVGEAGQFLDKWLASIHLSRNENAYIANIIKCRPPQNRDPFADEISACKAYLAQQVELLKPKAILAVGKFASQYLSGTEKTMGEMRGRFYMFRGIPVLCTYHPAAVLRDIRLKRPVWEDLKLLAKSLDIAI